MPTSRSAAATRCQASTSASPPPPDPFLEGDRIPCGPAGNEYLTDCLGSRLSLLGIYNKYIPGRFVVKTAKLFNNGRSQAVRLPKEFRFEGDEVYIKRVGNAVVLLPHQDSWQGLYESLERFSEDFMEDREQPAWEEERESPFV